MNVLIVKPSSLGDVIHALPAVHLLRQQLPDARLVWVVNREYRDVVRLSPDVDDVLVFDRQKLRCVGHWGQVPAFLRALRAGHFDLALDFQGLLRSSLIAFFSGAKRRVGFAVSREGARFFYREVVSVPLGLTHAVDRNVALVRHLFPGAASAPVVFPPLQQSSAGAENVAVLLREHGVTGTGPLVAVAPAARWNSKQWPDTFFAEVMDAVAMARPDATFCLVGTADERAIGERIVSASRCPRVINAMGRTDLITLVELLRHSRVLVANDSGPMHLGVAVQCPVVALFGPTDPQLTGPYGSGHTVLTGRCPVSPCFADRCRLGQRLCVADIRTTQAADAVLARLGGDCGMSGATL